jgi:3-hydroxy-9,10-secoandrosta-1,3,5(10)-triene-9,17-dione monooxygenase reductase component
MSRSVVALSGNPRPRSRTAALALTVARAVAELGSTDPVVEIDLSNRASADDDLRAILVDAEVAVVASPTYKATYTGLLKSFLDGVPTGALRGVVAIPVMVAGARGAAAGPGARMTVTAVDLRATMSAFATGVTVVSTLGEDGAPLGTTASAVASVSLDPPLVLVCLGHASNTLAALRRHGAFVVNVLHDAQADLAHAFAQPGPCEAWGDGPAAAGSGSLRLPDALATLDCELHDLLPGGDHAIVLGRVVATGAAHEERAPLLSYRRRLGGPDALDNAAA